VRKALALEPLSDLRFAVRERGELADVEVHQSGPDLPHLSRVDGVAFAALAIELEVDLVVVGDVLGEPAGSSAKVTISIALACLSVRKNVAPIAPAP
jgi:hypothetical protein